MQAAPLCQLRVCSLPKHVSSVKWSINRDSQTVLGQAATEGQRLSGQSPGKQPHGRAAGCGNEPG